MQFSIAVRDSDLFCWGAREHGEPGVSWRRALLPLAPKGSFAAHLCASAHLPKISARPVLSLLALLGHGETFMAMWTGSQVIS